MKIHQSGIVPPGLEKFTCLENIPCYRAGGTDGDIPAVFDGFGFSYDEITFIREITGDESG